MFPTAYSPEAPVAASSAGSSSAANIFQSAAQRMFPSAYSSSEAAEELPSSFASEGGPSEKARGKSRAVPRFDNQSAHGAAGPMTRL
jgi:hypothetical protein